VVEFDPLTYYPAFFAAVADAMVNQEFKADPDFNEHHRTSVTAEIFAAKPKPAFADDMAKVYEKLLQTVRSSGHFKGHETERAIAGADNVAMPIAMMLCSESIEVYRRKVLHPDFTAPFFARSADHDEDVIIAWIQREASAAEIAGASWHDFTLEPGDQVYTFTSPQVTWNVRTGRSGLAVIRADKLVHHEVTTLN